MNRVFRIIWNAALQKWVVISEIGKTRGKRNSVRCNHSKIMAVGLLGGALALGNVALAQDNCSLFGNCSTIIETIQLAQIDAKHDTSPSKDPVLREDEDIDVLTNDGTLVGSGPDNYVLNKKGDKALHFTNDGVRGQGIIDGHFNMGDGDNKFIAKNQSVLKGDLAFGTGNNTVSVDNSTIQDIKSKGALDVVISNNGQFTSLDATRHDDSDKKNQLTLDNATHEALDEKSAVTGLDTLHLKNDASFVNHGEFDLGKKGLLTIDENSSITLRDIDKDFAFGYDVQSKGNINVALAKPEHKITLGDKKFELSGRLAIQGGTFEINEKHSALLNEATLALEDQGIVNFDASKKHQLNSLELVGGTLDISGSTTVNALEVDSLKVSSGSQLKFDKSIDLGTSVKDFTGVNILDQMNQGGKEFITSANVTGQGSQLGIQDAGNSSVVELKDADGKEVIGKAHYSDIAIATDKGIEAAYGLNTIEIDKGKTLTVDNSTSSNHALGAKLTGEGNVALNANVDKTKPLFIGNQTSDYTGDTTINTGKVGFLADNSFGQTSKLTLKEDTHLDFNGYAQSIKEISAADESVLELNGGKLTIREGGVMDGFLRGDEGSLVLTGGKLDINNRNTDYSAKTEIHKDAEANLKHLNSLGTSTIHNEGLLTLNDSGEFNNKLVSDTAGGRLSVQGDHVVNLTADNQNYKGEIAIDEGSGIIATKAEQLGKGKLAIKGTAALQDLSGTVTNELTESGSLMLTAKSKVRLTADNSKFTGTFDIDKDAALTAQNKALGNANVKNAGKLTLDIFPNENITYTKKISGEGSVIKSGGGFLTITSHQPYTGETSIKEGMVILDNANLASSRVSISNSAGLATKGNVTIDGSLAVDNGEIHLSSRVPRSKSALGRLMSTYDGSGGLYQFGTLTVSQDLSGKSMIFLGGYLAGADTMTDKLVIEGKASGHHRLVLENIGGSGDEVNGLEIVTVNGENTAVFEHYGRTVAGLYEYFLKQDPTTGNVYLSSETDIQIPPTIPPKPWEPDPEGNEGTMPQQNYRPEVGSYIANLAAANNIFNHSINDRHYSTFQRNIWTRVAGSYERFKVGDSSLRNSVQNYSLQIGNDMYTQNLNGAVVKVGGVFGYGHTRSTNRNRATGYRSKGSGDGLSVGAYATYQHNDGLFIDGSLQYVYFDNDVKSDHMRDESYKTKGFLASLEVGQHYQVSDVIFVEPHAQVTWMGAKADAHVDGTGTNISGSKNNIQTRLGVRMLGKYLVGQTSVRPYAELNYVHNTKPYSVYFNDEKVSQAGTKSIGELQLGAHAKLDENTSIWGDLSHRFGKKSYSDTRLSVGLRYLF